MEIVALVRKQAPITGEQIAETLGISRPTIRSDLAVLVMLGYLDAKPKVGYTAGKAAPDGIAGGRKLLELKVKDIQGIPVIVRDTATVHDAVVTLFIENTSGLVVADENGGLLGVVSRKDLLKVTLGNASAASMPVTLVMTRKPNVVTVGPDDYVIDAARKMIHHQVESLPVVVRRSGTGSGSGERGEDWLEVVGRVSKTSMTRVLVEVAAGFRLGGGGGDDE
ncbi:helix-turn-helix transcriptional regulator [Paenibacillus chartarius]|uniref:Helix-turn-helix transcriptional regulator n=1 Tax=Paenibacillus chartarius TaxID=747481 RepID=A0ABV6DGD4_9BACL